ncbi:MAG: formylmethanofuran--tetrahydromethanopterin N-formyltransferase [Pirellulales bacterium]
MADERFQRLVDDTYAEAFRSIYAEVLITARDRTWLDHAINAATGNASSTIFCDCEAGLDRYVGPGGDESFATPDGRPGAIVQFHVPRFHKDRAARLERSLLVRLSQNVLTCPTTACFNLLDTEEYFKLGRKIAFFGDGYQKRALQHGRRVWTIPILGGEFTLDRRFGYRDGLMGGNVWFLGDSVDSALEAAGRARDAAVTVPEVILPFPGGIAGSGSKAGSRYSFSIASTYAEFCPTLREELGERSKLPPGVASVMEIILNGRDLPTIAEATRRAVEAALETPGLVKISAGNYNGRLGKSFIYLHPERQLAAT